MSLLSTGKSSNVAATQTESSDAARMATSSAISVVPTRSLEGRVLALNGVAGRAATLACRLRSSLSVPFATRTVSVALRGCTMGRSSNLGVAKTPPAFAVPRKPTTLSASRLPSSGPEKQVT